MTTLTFTTHFKAFKNLYSDVLLHKFQLSSKLMCVLDVKNEDLILATHFLLIVFKVVQWPNIFRIIVILLILKKILKQTKFL